MIVKKYNPFVEVITIGGRVFPSGFIFDSLNKNNVEIY